MRNILKNFHSSESSGLDFFRPNIIRNIGRPITKPSPSVIKISTVVRGLKIEPLSGESSITDYANRFHFVDSDYYFFGLNKPSEATPQTYLDVLQFTSECSLYSVFHSLSNEFKDIALTQSQILCFCEVYREFLTQKFANFFVVDNGSEYMATILYYDETGMRFHLNRFVVERNNYWSYNDCKPRLIIKSQSIRK